MPAAGGNRGQLGQVKDRLFRRRAIRILSISFREKWGTVEHLYMPYSLLLSTYVCSSKMGSGGSLVSPPGRCEIPHRSIRWSPEPPQGMGNNSYLSIICSSQCHFTNTLLLMRYFSNQLTSSYCMLYSLHTVIHCVSPINLLSVIRDYSYYSEYPLFH